MEEAPENGKELSHSAHVNGVNEMNEFSTVYCKGKAVPLQARGAQKFPGS